MASKPKWPADKVERRNVADLIPSARNARTHSDEQVAQIAASITEWGWTMPVLIDGRGNIIAGHGRIMAAELLGLADVPVMVARGWTAAQRRAYAIADNQLALNAGWDFDILAGEFADLKLGGFDLDLTGFGEMELADLLTSARDITDIQAEWDGMPEYQNTNKTAFRSIIIHFKDQGAVDEFAKETKVRITEKTRFCWFPQIEIERYKDKRYEGES